VRAFSLHPGRIPTTDLGRHLSTDDLWRFGVVDERGDLIADPAAAERLWDLIGRLTGVTLR